MLLWLLAHRPRCRWRSRELLFNKQAETTWRNPFVMGAMLIAIGVLMWVAERAGRKARDLASVNLAGRAGHRRVAGAGGGSGLLAQRHHHQRRACSGTWTGRPRRAISFLLSTPAIGGRGCQDALGHAQAASAARASDGPIRRRRGGERAHRLRGHRLVSALFASQRITSVCVLSHYFWHNSACSGFHPPASVMKLLSPTRHNRAERSRRLSVPVAGPRDALEPGFVSRPGSLVGHGCRFAPSQSGRISRLVPRGPALSDLRRGRVSFPPVDFRSGVAVDPVRTD